MPQIKKKRVLNVKSLTVYLSREMDKKVRAQAKADARTLSAITELAFRNYFERAK